MIMHTLYNDALINIQQCIISNYTITNNKHKHINKTKLSQVIHNIDINTIWITILIDTG